MPILVKALKYDEKRGNYTVGTYTVHTHYTYTVHTQYKNSTHCVFYSLVKDLKKGSRFDVALIF